MRRLILVVLAALLAGCAPQTLNVRPIKSYQVGQRLTAAPGDPILVVETGTIRTVRRWVGILNSPDGWETTAASDSSYVKKELLYSGGSNRSIEISYREYRGGLAAPAFFQTAKYDLTDSKIITFQNFQFEVYSADNNGMTGKLLRDGTGAVALPGPAPGTSAAGGSAPQGKDTVQVEQLAKTQACSAQPRVTLTASGAGFETYSVPCSNGDAWTVRCEFGNCRRLQ